MDKVKLIRPEKINLKNHPVLNEGWLQEVIAKNPEILGLGDLVLKDKERKQPRAGRLDILLQDADINKRYEVEVQLGKTDESHIIRTIEYWDIERKRYPQYEHCAVIVAEEITSRFLNVISLFNGNIPLIAVQLTAYKTGEEYFLTFNTVLDEMSLGLVEEDEEVSATADRHYWENIKGAPKTVKIVDEVLAIITDIIPGYELKYNKFYIGLAQNGSTDNFIIFRAKKSFMRMEIRLDHSDELEREMEEKGLDLMDYEKRGGRYRIKLSMNDIKKHREFIAKLIRKAKGIESETKDNDESST
jgi:hypothetical protein